MRVCKLAFPAAALALAAGSPHEATVKVGIIGPFSGPFARCGTLLESGVEACITIQGRHW